MTLSTLTAPLVRAYRVVVDHLGKLMATVGGTLISLDLAGYGQQVKAAVQQDLGPKWAHYVAIGFCVAMGARFLWAGLLAQKKQAQIDALQKQLEAKKT
jgi:hypothetical protein